MDDRSERNLLGVHQDLVRVVRKAHEAWAIGGLDFVVTEGIRTREKQLEYVRVGASQTMNSRHLTGHAVDVAIKLNGRVVWDWPLYERLAKVMKGIALAEGVDLVWGGDWHTFKDGPHYELSRDVLA